jgi:hypothetical protein
MLVNLNNLDPINLQQTRSFLQAQFQVAVAHNSIHGFASIIDKTAKEKQTGVGDVSIPYFIGITAGRMVGEFPCHMLRHKSREQKKVEEESEDM